MADPSETTYDKTPLNKIRRHPERGLYDKSAVSAIVNEAKILHVAWVDSEGLPQCIPMVGAWDEDETGQAYIYLHGYPNNRILSSLGEIGTPICATATLLDGLVLALSVFSHSMNYRSAVSHGVALPFTGTDEEKDAAKMHAFEKIVEASAEGRWDHARRPDAADMRGTGVVRMKVETARFDLFVVYAFVPLVDHVVLYSAKARSGPPKDDKKDTENKELVAKTWTGVIPLKTIPQTPIPSSYCPEDMAKKTPEHVVALATAKNDS